MRLWGLLSSVFGSTYAYVIWFIVFFFGKVMPFTGAMIVGSAYYAAYRFYHNNDSVKYLEEVRFTSNRLPLPVLRILHALIHNLAVRFVENKIKTGCFFGYYRVSFAGLLLTLVSVTFGVSRLLLVITLKLFKLPKYASIEDALFPLVMDNGHRKKIMFYGGRWHLNPKWDKLAEALLRSKLQNLDAKSRDDLRPWLSSKLERAASLEEEVTFIRAKVKDSILREQGRDLTFDGGKVFTRDGAEAPKGRTWESDKFHYYVDIARNEGDICIMTKHRGDVDQINPYNKDIVMYGVKYPYDFKSIASTNTTPPGGSALLLTDIKDRLDYSTAKPELAPLSPLFKASINRGAKEFLSLNFLEKKECLDDLDREVLKNTTFREKLTVLEQSQLLKLDCSDISSIPESALSDLGLHNFHK